MPTGMDGKNCSDSLPQHKAPGQDVKAELKVNCLLLTKHPSSAVCLLYAQSISKHCPLLRFVDECLALLSNSKESDQES